VLGGFERAFYGDQCTQLALVLAAYGAQLLLPEINGPGDPANQLYLALLKLLVCAHGARCAYRVTDGTSMTAQPLVPSFGSSGAQDHHQDPRAD